MQQSSTWARRGNAIRITTISGEANGNDKMIGGKANGSGNKASSEWISITVVEDEMQQIELTARIGEARATATLKLSGIWNFRVVNTCIERMRARGQVVQI